MFCICNLICIISLIVTIALCVYTIIKIKSLSDYVDEIDSQITTLTTHTDGAFKGSYFMFKKLEDEFNSHCHSYEFNNGVLYIEEPIINSPKETEEKSE